MVTAAAAASVFLQYAFERFFGDRRKLAEIRERALRGRPTEEDLILMNKIMLRRMLFILIVFLPLIYALNRLGDIPTPLGVFPAVWWFVGNALLFSIVAGGVQAWSRTRGASRR